MLDKFLKNISIENLYLGFRVRKETISKTIEQDSTNLSNIITLTYLSDTFHIFIKEEDGYYDPKLKKHTKPITDEELLSVHEEYGNNYLNLKDYNPMNKNELFGVFGLMHIDEVVETLKNTDTLYDSPEIYYNKEEGITLMAAEILQKDLNKFFKFGPDYIEGPLLSKDELDPYPVDYFKKEDFLNEITGKNPIQIKEHLKHKKNKSI